MRKTILTSILSFFLVLILTDVVSAQFNIDVETGSVFSGYNDVRIPGEGGTLFSLSEELEADPALFVRLRIIYDFNPRHHLGILYAPLSIRSEGSLNRELIFEDGTFTAGTQLKATYKFNSYRLFYRYDFVKREKIEAGIGFTAKIRDAAISIESNDDESIKTNVGFVPIIHFRLLWNFHEKAGFILEGDALAAPQGRAEDILAALNWQVSDRIGIRLGYRILEGGADNDEVYNFALVHYASLGGRIRF